MIATSARREITRTTLNFLGSLVVGVIIAFAMNFFELGWDGIALSCIPPLFVCAYNTFVLLETNETEERKNVAFNVVIMALAFIASLCLTFYILQMIAH